MRRAEEAANSTETALEMAQKAFTKAQQVLKDSQDKLAVVEADLATHREEPERSELTPELPDAVRSLVAALERHSFAGVPPQVREALEFVHASLKTDEPSAEAAPVRTIPAAPGNAESADGPLSQRGRVRTAEEAALSPREQAQQPQHQEADAMLIELDGGGDDSDAALAEMVRRHRARRRV